MRGETTTIEGDAAVPSMLLGGWVAPVDGIRARSAAGEAGFRSRSAGRCAFLGFCCAQTWSSVA